MKIHLSSIGFPQSLTRCNYMTPSLSFTDFEQFCIRVTENLKKFLSKDVSLLNYEPKEDGSPVSSADFTIEDMIRREISQNFPDHGIQGEERADHRHDSPFNWIIDPIDGTLSYLHGVPLYGCLIGFSINEEVKYGFMRLPAVANEFLSGDGTQARLNGKPVLAKQVADFKSSLILTTDMQTLEKSEYSKLWTHCIEQGATSRTWGDCFGYYLLCTGRADMMVDVGLKQHDILPIYPILRGSGVKYESRRYKSLTDIVAMTAAFKQLL